MEGDLKPAGDSPDIGRQAGGGSTTMGGRIDLDSCGTAASSSMQGQGTQENERNAGRIAKLGREERRPVRGVRRWLGWGWGTWEKTGRQKNHCGRARPDATGRLTGSGME